MGKVIDFRSVKHKNDKDVLFFSIEELFRCIPTDYMDYKAILTKKLGSVDFDRITYGK